MGGYLTDGGEVRFIRCKFLYRMNFAMQVQHFFCGGKYLYLQNVGN
jgi:hypothetical protein